VTFLQSLRVSDVKVSSFRFNSDYNIIRLKYCFMIVKKSVLSDTLQRHQRHKISYQRDTPKYVLDQAWATSSPPSTLMLAREHFLS